MGVYHFDIRHSVFDIRHSHLEVVKLRNEDVHAFSSTVL